MAGAATPNNMEHSNYITSANDKPLFTPGPLTTSRTVKQAMLRDLGSRDVAFVNLVKDVRQRVLAICGVAAPDYECVIIQGSGTFSVEAVISSAVPAAGKLLPSATAPMASASSRLPRSTKLMQPCSSTRKMASPLRLMWKLRCFRMRR